MDFWEDIFTLDGKAFLYLEQRFALLLCGKTHSEAVAAACHFNVVTTAGCLLGALTMSWSLSSKLYIIGSTFATWMGQNFIPRNIISYVARQGRYGLRFASIGLIACSCRRSLTELWSRDGQLMPKLSSWRILIIALTWFCAWITLMLWVLM